MSTDNVVTLRSGRRRKPPAAPPSADPPLRALLDSWRLALDAKGLAQGTIASYTRTLRDLIRWCEDTGAPTGVARIRPEHIRAYLTAVRERSSAGNAHKDWRNLKVFFHWCVKEEERTPPSPMTGVEEPAVTRKEPDVFTDDEIRALFAVCSGNTFEDRRDLAILMIFADNGMRVSGMAGLRYVPDDDRDNDVFLDRRQLRVRRSRGGVHWAPIGKRTAAALDRYLRVRAKRPYADSPWLWLPSKARRTREGEIRLTLSGIEQMVERRGKEAGIAYAQPHKFRRTFATRWEGDPRELQRIGGWDTLEMVRQYQSARTDAPAPDTHYLLSPVDRL